MATIKSSKGEISRVSPLPKQNHLNKNMCVSKNTRLALMFIVEMIYQKVKCFHGVYQKVFKGDEKGKLHCSYWNWKFWSIKHQLDIISSDVHSSIKKKKKKLWSQTWRLFKTFSGTNGPFMSILWSLWTVLRLEDPVEIDLATGFFCKDGNNWGN